MNKLINKSTKSDIKMRHFCSVPNVSNLIYPPKCGVCGKLSEDFLCKKCRKMLENEGKFKVEKVFYEEKNFNEHMYFFKYEGIIRRLILNYKFKEQSYLYKTFVNFLLKNEKFFEITKKYDTIVPVPISKKRYKERGYNQSYLLAKELVKETNLNLENECLFKTKNIIEQSKLNKEERLKNIQGVYELRNKEKLFNKNIILLDDIYTTGSTAVECCKILKEALPKKIGVLTIAKD